MKKPRATPVAISLSLLLALASSLWSIPSLEAQTDPFYKGKMIRVIVCCAPGGLYDQWARLFARYMGRYIPGNPNIIVQNMAGASGIIAANYVYNVARPDGLSIAIPIGAIYLPQLAGEKEVRFDVRKFNWIGSQEKSAELFYVRTDTGFRTVEDIVKAKEPPKVSSTGAGSAGDIVPQILEVIAGAKFTIVRGYPGGTIADLAVERGEVVGRGLSIATFFSREPFLSWVKKGFVIQIAQTGLKRDPRSADVPTIYELMDQYKTPEINRRIVRVLAARGEFGRPFVVAPGVPADRVEILRRAYDQALKDSELLAEARKMKLDQDMDPTTGEELQALARELMDQPPQVVEGVRKVLEGN